MIKKAMIMAAGAGTRLGALSDIVPKPLAPLANVPVIDIILKHLASYGIKDVIANTFYKAEDIQKHCINNDFGVNFNYVHEKELSGTAGGLSKCRFFFDNEEDFIVMSGDGLTDINIEAAYTMHRFSNAIATIITKEVNHNEISKYGVIVPDENGFVKSFQEKPSAEEALSNLANTGTYIFKREIFRYIPENAFYDFAKDVFPALMHNNIKINTHIHKGYWSDIGSIEQYRQANFDILNNRISIIHPEIIHTRSGKYTSGKNLYIASGAEFTGCCAAGRNCSIGKNAVIKNSILWDNVKVNDGAVIDNSIILSGASVSGFVRNEIVSSGRAAVLS